MRSGPGAHGGGCGEHGRGEQHDRRVQAEYGGDQRGDREHHAQQAFRRTAAQPSGGRTRVPEDAGVVGELRQHQDRGQEADGRAEHGQFVPCVAPRHQAGPDDQGGGGDRAGRFRHAAGTRHGEAEHGDEQQQREHRIER
jgi:hypothetical protein